MALCTNPTRLRAERLLDDTRASGAVPTHWVMTVAAWRALLLTVGIDYDVSPGPGCCREWAGLPVQLDDALVDMAGDPLAMQLTSRERGTG